MVLIQRKRSAERKAWGGGNGKGKPEESGHINNTLETATEG